MLASLDPEVPPSNDDGSPGRMLTQHGQAGDHLLISAQSCIATEYFLWGIFDTQRGYELTSLFVSRHQPRHHLSSPRLHTPSWSFGGGYPRSLELGLRKNVQPHKMTTFKDGMGDEAVLGEDLPLPPARLFERLSLIPGYTWDHSVRHEARHLVWLALTCHTVYTISYQLRPLVSTIRIMLPGIVTDPSRVGMYTVYDTIQSLIMGYPTRPVRQLAPPHDRVQVEVPRNSMSPARACDITGAVSARQTVKSRMPDWIRRPCGHPSSQESARIPSDWKENSTITKFS